MMFDWSRRELGGSADKLTRPIVNREDTTYTTPTDFSISTDDEEELIDQQNYYSTALANTDGVVKRRATLLQSGSYARLPA